MKLATKTTNWKKQLNTIAQRVQNWIDGNFPPAPACLVASILLLGNGCAAVRDSLDGSVKGPFHEVHNYYSAANGWQDEIQVVAVMPLVSGRGNEGSQQGVEQMQPVLTEELARFDQFEAITITQEKLTGLVGVKQVRPLEPLPNKFQEIIKHLNKEKGTRQVVDAIMFCELSTYRPYPPLAMGWKMHLYDMKSQELIWAFDEVFNVGDTRMNNSARRFLRNQRLTTMANFSEIMIFDSPRALARYSLHEIMGTMRKKNTKELEKTADTTSSQ